MKFDTNSPFCFFNFEERELSFLVYKIIDIESKEYGSFDPAGMILRNILEVLLCLNEVKTIEFIESLDDEKFEIVSSRFGSISATFQSKNFVKKIEAAAKKHIKSKYYKWILDNIEEAKKAVDDTETST
jgi:hypothetical protein